MKKAIIASIILLNLTLVVGIGLYIAGVIPGNSSKADNADVASEEAEEVKAISVFYALNPVVVNIQDGRKMRFMQIEMKFLARTEDISDVLDHLEPLIRHELILHVSALDGSSIRTAEAKEALRQYTLQMVNSVLEKEGETMRIEDVLFSKLILQ